VASLLWILAAAVAIFGIVSLLSGASLAGLVLLGVAVILAPAGRVLHV
jgi:hypothetical protein